MRKLLFIIVLFLASGAGMAWLVDHPGEVIINWEGWQLEMSFAVLAMGFAFLLVIALLLEAGLIWAKRELPLVGGNRHFKQQQRGLKALNQAVLALAHGEGAEAKRLANKASRLLPPQPMTHVIAAQAAELVGDIEAARHEFEELSQSGEGSFLGVRGLLISALSEGRSREALRLAEEALALQPKSKWAIRTHFQLLINDANWEEALKTFKMAKKEKCFEGGIDENLEKAILYCRAREADLSGDAPKALALAKESYQFDKSFIPSALLLSRLEKGAGNPSKAAKVIESSWNLIQDRKLAEAYLDLEAGERATERLRRIKKLISKTKNSVEGKIQLADRFIQAEHFEEAEVLIDELLEETTLQRVFKLKAELIRSRGDGGAFEWERKAESGERDPIYRCNNCGSFQLSWVANCPTCEEFGSFEYRNPKEIIVNNPTTKIESPILTMLPEDGAEK